MCENELTRSVTQGQADAVFVGRQFQKNPGSVWAFAEELGVKITVAHQIEWGFIGRGGIGRTGQAIKSGTEHQDGQTKVASKM